MFLDRLRRPRAAQSTAPKLPASAGKPRNARPRTAAVGFLVALATMGLALAPQAASAATLTYSVAIVGNVAQAGASSTFNVTVTNNSASPEINTVVINVPAAFAVTGVGTPTPGAWTVAQSGNQITLTGLLHAGASVTVPITATAPGATGQYKWATSASGRAGTFSRTGGDPSVTVALAAAAVACAPNTPCISPTLSAGATPTGLATDAQVTGQSGPQGDELTVILPDPTAAPLLCEQTDGTFGQIVTWAVTTRTSTLVYTVHTTNSGYTYDLGDTCFGSTQPFPGAVQNPANGNEYEGTLPYCVGKEPPHTVSPPPCVESIVTTGHGNDPRTVTVTVDAPQGDPKFTG